MRASELIEAIAAQMRYLDEDPIILVGVSLRADIRSITNGKVPTHPDLLHKKEGRGRTNVIIIKPEM